MIKRILAVASAVLLLVFGTSCNKNKAEVTELLYDSEFQTGFRILGIDASLDGNTAFGYLDLGAPQSSILWRLAQWGTRYDLGESADSGTVSGNEYTWSNAGKTVSVKKGEGAISLAVHGSEEYVSPRKSGQAWPHLLIEQEINSTVRIGDYSKIIAEIEFEIPYVDNKTGVGYDPLLHTAQFQWIFSIANRNPSTAGLKGDYFWLNLDYYDFRYPVTQTGGAYDGGKADSTSKYIYSLGSGDMGAEISLASRVKVSVDILPVIKNAFATAQQNGAMRGTLESELGISATNIGWEVPGTFDCRVDIYSLSLKGVK